MTDEEIIAEVDHLFDRHTRAAYFMRKRGFTDVQWKGRHQLHFKTHRVVMDFEVKVCLAAAVDEAARIAKKTRIKLDCAHEQDGVYNCIVSFHDDK